MNDLQKKQTTLLLTSKALESKHYTWMIEAALKHFVDAVEEQEAIIARHRAMLQEGAPRFVESYERHEDPSREKDIAKAKDWHRQYSACAAFLSALKDVALHIEAENFASWFIGTIKGGRK